MGEFELWVYRGLIGLLLFIVWWVFKQAIANIENKFTNIEDKFKNIEGKFDSIAKYVEGLKATILEVSNKLQSLSSDTGVSIVQLSGNIDNTIAQLQIRDERINNVSKTVDMHTASLEDHNTRLRYVEVTICDKADCPKYEARVIPTSVPKTRTNRKPKTI